ncbi:MAG TPA: DUF1461 domain-containing protein [Candidatus Limnocylindrales bacterium]|nr:DUF1461 domain-containing protein [Candidatus Limnocylindrales bacterium]
MILGASIAPFLAPPVVRFEQERSQVEAWTGFSTRAVDEATLAILGDLVLWLGDFDIHVSNGPIGEGVLSEADRSHMRDVRRVFTLFWVLVAASATALVIAARRARGDASARAAAWRAASRGALVLAVVIAAAGTFALVAFDAAFELFHRLLFSGNYTFDPATDRLVQLFPEQFWSEIAIAVGVVAIAVSLVVAWLAGRRAGAVRAMVAA